MNIKIYTERPEDDDYLVFWFGNLKDEDKEEYLEHSGVLTKLPGDYVYMEKTTEYRCLNYLQRAFPEQYPFHQTSFVVPR